jgi:hypothetical protein
MLKGTVLGLGIAGALFACLFADSGFRPLRPLFPKQPNAADCRTYNMPGLPLHRRAAEQAGRACPQPPPHVSAEWIASPRHPGVSRT